MLLFEHLLGKCSGMTTCTCYTDALLHRAVAAGRCNLAGHAGGNRAVATGLGYAGRNRAAAARLADSTAVGHRAVATSFTC